MTILITILVLPTTTKGRLTLEEIKDQTGYTEININEADIVKKTDIIIHVIKPQDIIDILNDISKNIETLDVDHKGLLNTELKHLKNKIKTIVPRVNRNKRGLVNLVGSVSKWLFGTMDEEDRINIENHFKNIEINNHNAITNLNQQVVINDNFSNSFKQIRDIIQKDRTVILGQLNNVASKTINQNLFYDQLFKVQIIKEKIDHIQENLASARYGMLHPNLLSDEEIQKYDIDLNKMKYLKLGVIKFKENALLFAIKIPREIVKIQLRMIIPIPNKDFKEIDSSNEIVFKNNNLTFQYKEFKSLNELSISKHCIYQQNCKLIKNNKTEILSLDDETIVIKNAYQLKITQNCDDRNLNINGNVLIHFNNCEIKILDNYFSNVKEIFQNRFYYPTNQTKKFSEKITLDDILLKNEKNIQKIDELQYHKNISYGINLTLLICLITLIIFSIIIRNKIKFKDENKIQENFNQKGGEVMYMSHSSPSMLDIRLADTFNSLHGNMF